MGDGAGFRRFRIILRSTALVRCLRVANPTFRRRSCSKGSISAGIFSACTKPRGTPTWVSVAPCLWSSRIPRAWRWCSTFTTGVSCWPTRGSCCTSEPAVRNVCAWRGENDPDLPFPRHGYTQSAFRPGCDPPAVAVVEQAGAIRERELAQSSRELEAKYASRDMAHWARRFDEALSGRGRPLRVLAAVSVHTTFLQHSMRDIKRALESLGHECMVLMERSNHHVIGTLTYHAAMREFDPDLFLSIDHLRPEFGEIVPSNLPVLTWDQDLLPQVFTDKNMRLVPRQDFLVGCAKPNWVKAGLNPRQFLHARVPTCPEQFGGDPLTEAEQARYACDVSYVSHASQTPKAFHEEERSLYSDFQRSAPAGCGLRSAAGCDRSLPCTDGAHLRGCARGGRAAMSGGGGGWPTALAVALVVHVALE